MPFLRKKRAIWNCFGGHRSLKNILIPKLQKLIQLLQLMRGKHSYLDYVLEQCTSLYQVWTNMLTVIFPLSSFLLLQVGQVLCCYLFKSILNRFKVVWQIYTKTSVVLKDLKDLFLLCLFAFLGLLFLIFNGSSSNPKKVPYFNCSKRK